MRVFVFAATLLVGMLLPVCSSPAPVSPPSSAQSLPTTGAGTMTAPGAAASLAFEVVHMVSPTTGWGLALVDQSLELLRTHNGGTDWVMVSPARLSGPNLLAAGFLGIRRAWVLTDSPEGRYWATTYRTDDAGTTWHRGHPFRTDWPVLRDAGYVNPALQFTDPRHGWLVEGLNETVMGSFPVSVFRTTDAGSTWTKVSDTGTPTGVPQTPHSLPYGCMKTGVAFTSRSTGWVGQWCGIEGSGSLWVSHDGGSTWSGRSETSLGQIPVRSACREGGCGFTAPAFASRSTLLVPFEVPEHGWLFSTSNAGESWAVHPLPRTPHPLSVSVYFVDPKHGWLVPFSHRGTVFRTENGGVAWTRVRTNVPLLSPPGVDFVDAAYGWVFGYSSHTALLLKTADGGRTWTRLQPSLTS